MTNATTRRRKRGNEQRRAKPSEPGNDRAEASRGRDRSEKKNQTQEGKGTGRQQGEPVYKGRRRRNAERTEQGRCTPSSGCHEENKGENAPKGVHKNRREDPINLPRQGNTTKKESLVE